MPPHLHPRSLLTTSLFTTTLAISFLVVGLPHLLPCPVQPKAYMDSQSPEDPLAPRRRRRKRLQNTDNNDGEAEGRIAAEVEGEERFSRGRGRECPVPKPGGLIGTVLGFEKGEKAARPIVRIAPLAERRSRPRTEGEGGQG